MTDGRSPLPPRDRGDRGQSVSINYTLSLVIVSLLMSGLFISVSGFLDNERERVTRSELEVIGNRIAADVSTADRMARTTGSDGVVKVWTPVPETVAGSVYMVNVTSSSTGSEFYDVEIRLQAPAVGVSRVVTTKTRVEVNDSTLSVEGGAYEVVVAGSSLDLPDPDHGCDWVDDETDGGTDDLKVISEIIDCDADTAKVVEVDDGTIIGDTDAGKSVDADDATFYGDVEAEDGLDVQTGKIYGDAVSEEENVNLDNATVTGTVDAAKVAEAIGGTTVEADMLGDNQVKVVDSTVEGDVVSDGGDVTLDNATVEGDVYVDTSTETFSCTDSTINGQDCSEYTPKDPDDY